MEIIISILKGMIGRMRTKEVSFNTEFLASFCRCIYKNSKIWYENVK